MDEKPAQRRRNTSLDGDHEFALLHHNKAHCEAKYKQDGSKYL